ncbi:MAG: type II secretion system F family protein [Campylobacterales bacterium]|nr:type II secretion system F family protein [Campylobacterales bacterium]
MSYSVWYQKNGKICKAKIDRMDQLDQYENIVKVDHKKQVRFDFQQISKEQLLQLLLQIQIYLKAKMSLSDALEVALEDEKNTQIKSLLKSTLHTLSSANGIEQTLGEQYKKLPKDFLFFLQLGIDSGSMEGVIDALVKLFQEHIEAKKRFFTALRYPIFLLFSLLGSLAVIFYFVIPNFKAIFDMYAEKLPLSTQILLYLNQVVLQIDFFILFLYLVGIFLFFVFLGYRYKYNVDKIVFSKIFLISNLYKHYIFYKTFLAMWLLLGSKFQFQVALQGVIQLSTNRFFHHILKSILTDIEQGVSIKDAFGKYKIFDDVTIKLLSAAQRSNQYEVVMQDLFLYHQQMFYKKLDILFGMLEPLMILFIGLIVLWLVLAIMTPIWSMGVVLS